MKSFKTFLAEETQRQVSNQGDWEETIRGNAPHQHTMIHTGDVTHATHSSGVKLGSWNHKTKSGWVLKSSHFPKH